jgi:hypothetical protein
MTHRIVVLPLVSVLLLALAVQGDPVRRRGVDPSRLDQLIQQLGSAKFADRERAMKELEALGPGALPQLRKAVQSADRETSQRASVLVRKIEAQAQTAAILTPKMLRLTLQDTPLAEAVQQLAKLSGYSINLRGGVAALANRTVTLDTGTTTFWDALEQLCRTANLQELRPTSASASSFASPRQPGFGPGGKKGGGKGTKSGPLASSNSYTIVLTDGALPEMPVFLANAVRVRVPPTGQALSKTVPAGETVIVLDFRAEPRFQDWRIVGDALIEKALDDQGQTLTAVLETPHLPLSGAPVGDDPALPPGIRPLPMVPDNGPLANLPAGMAAVRLKLGEKPAKHLLQLSGKLSMQVLQTPEALASMDDILQAAGKSVISPDGTTLRVNKVEQQANGMWVIQVTMENLPTSNTVAAVGKAAAKISSRIAVNAGMPRLLDANGLPFLLADRLDQKTLAVNGQLTIHSTLVYQAQPGQGAPVRLALFGQRNVTIWVPFTLKNIPLS